jgi:hypothetical protein
MEEATSIDATVATLVPPAAGPASRPEPAAAAPAAAWFSLDTDVGLGGEPVREWLAVSPVGLSGADGGGDRRRHAAGAGRG